MPVFCLVFFVLSAIYILNIIFIQENPLNYFNQQFLNIVIVTFLFIFCFYTSIISLFLNLFKFGNIKLLAKFINTPYIISNDIKVYYYNSIGMVSKSLELVSKFIKLEKRSLTKILIADTFIQANKYKSAEKILATEIMQREYDLVQIRKALLVAVKNKDLDKALSLSKDALDANKSGLIRNAEPKHFEIELILADIYYRFEKNQEAFDLLSPLYDDINNHTFYYICKYNALLLSKYYLLYAKIIIKQHSNTDTIQAALKNSIKLFKDSTYAKEARMLLSKYSDDD